jgi:hypothetical protein
MRSHAVLSSWNAEAGIRSQVKSFAPLLKTFTSTDHESMHRKPSCACGGGCPACAQKIASPGFLHAEALHPPQTRNPGEPGSLHLRSGESDCSPTWFGDTTPEVDPNGGSFTGKLKVTYNDPVLKDPCVRECVEQHEAVHVRDLTPIVKKIHDCDVAAGDDWNKKGICNQMATRELVGARARSECNAYRASFTCLTLKVLDSSSPCSKSPHREQVQKHRGYDGCELKRQCNEAGTPELGIPNA